jgi:hypothetical protein
MSRGLTHDQATKLYGPIANGKWPDEVKHMVVFSVDPALGFPWKNIANNGPVSHIYMNRDMVTPFMNACKALKESGCYQELRTFDGCFCIRDVRALPGSPSAHSYGLAIDINSKENPLNGKPHFTPEFVKCFTDAGFDWGGNFHRLDGMHFSYAWEGKKKEPSVAPESLTVATQ